MNETEFKILKECEAFIKDRAGLQASEVQDQERALRRMNNFWDEENKRQWKRTNRHNLSFSKFNVWTDAIASPFIKSPYHIELQPRMDNFQEGINAFEHAFGTKMCYRQAIKRGTACGAGFVTIGLDNGEPRLEFIQNQGSVVWDDTDTTPSLENQQKFAIVKFIDKFTASQKYGWDSSDTSLNLNGLTRWGETEKKVPLVMYYRMENGKCSMYTICGQSVKAYPLNVSRIPVARFAGWQVYGTEGISYQGVVQRLYDLVLSENIAFSQMVERSSRSLKAKLKMSVESMKGLAGPLSKVESDESLIVPFNKDGGEPGILEEHFQTADLTELISNIRNLQQDTLGIALTGLQGVDKTATETMLQQTNSESNVEEIYMNAEMAVRHISRCIIEMVTGGDLDFQLENGPAVITVAAKERQELGLVASMVPDTMKPLIASRIADSLNNEDGKSLAEDIRANYGELKTTVGTDVGVLTNRLTQTEGLLQEAIGAGEEFKQQIVEQQKTIEDLQKRLLEMEISQMNMEDQNKISVAKMELDHQQQAFDNQVKVAELEAKVELEEQKNQIASEKNVIQAMK